MTRSEIVLGIEELIDDEKRRWKLKLIELLEDKRDYYGKIAAVSSVAVIVDLIALVQRKL